MMPTKNVGPKGQILIPKRMREALGLKPGVEVTLELRDQEIIIKKPQVKGSYTEYFITTSSPKLKKKINIKELLNQEVEERNALH
jgi:AbrB family looped-hinge helix DNA binding protein